MSLTTTQYHYLIVIAQLSKKLKEVKSIDVAIELGVARATTSRMINYLVAEGWVNRERRALTLSSKAESLLRETDEHYHVLFEFFSRMNLDALEIKSCVDVLCDQIQSSTLHKICEYVKGRE